MAFFLLLRMIFWNGVNRTEHWASLANILAHRNKGHAMHPNCQIVLYCCVYNIRVHSTVCRSLFWCFFFRCFCVANPSHRFYLPFFATEKKLKIIICCTLALIIDTLLCVSANTRVHIQWKLVGELTTLKLILFFVFH